MAWKVWGYLEQLLSADLNGNFADCARLTEQQTLTNKTLLSPVITTPVMKFGYATKTADYTILDDDGFLFIESSNDANIALPTLSDNRGRLLIIRNVAYPPQTCQVNVEGTDRIRNRENIEMSQIQLYSSAGETLVLFGSTTYWEIVSYFDINML
jgi:hypothetical protein